MTMEVDQALLPDDVDAEASTEPAEQPVVEVDPRDARLADLESKLERLNGLDPNKIGPALGRISALQSELAAIRDRNPAADLDPRISANETLTVTLAQALAASDLVDERFKQSLNSALTGIEQAKTERERNRLEASLVDKITKQITPAQAQDSDPWIEATLEVTEVAKELGVEATAIPWADIKAAAGDSPLRAVRLATKWLNDNHTDPTMKRVADRKQAAGNGSPARVGTGPSITDMSDADSAYSKGEITHEQYVKHRNNFGLSLIPGGGR